MNLELIQFPFSPFCIIPRLILDFAEVPYVITDIPPQDRSLVWELTQHQHYGVPVVRCDDDLVYDREHETQEVAKFLNERFKLGLFPQEREGEQILLWRYIENDLENVSFRPNDVFYREYVAPEHQLQQLRFKERKFGNGYIERTKRETGELLAQVTNLLQPFDRMLAHRPFLLGSRPYFVDFDLAGCLGNYLFSGHLHLPQSLEHLRRWHSQILQARQSQFASI